MYIGAFKYEQFLEQIRSFHGNIAPGVVLGGIMLEFAQRHLPEGCIFDAVCETGYCLPDAVQILTPCTIGNGWLKVLPWGRFALSLYDKYTGEGIQGDIIICPSCHEAYPKKDGNVCLACHLTDQVDYYLSDQEPLSIGEVKK